MRISCKIIYGDCLEVLPNVGIGVADMCFNDLPYGTTACSWDSVIPFSDMWEALNPVMKEKAAKIFTGTEPFSSHLRLSNLKEFKYDWYWLKNKCNNFLNAKKMPMKNIETIAVFYMKLCTYNPQQLKDVYKVIKNSTKTIKNNNISAINGGCLSTEKYIQHKASYPNQSLNFKLVSKPLHRTQKPVALIEYLIKTYTNEGDTVIDITAGSGSTGMAARETKRNSILIEKSPLWYNVAVRRNQGEEMKTLKAYIKEMREKYGKRADFDTPLDFPEEVTICG